MTIETRQRFYRLLAANPEIRQIVALALELEDEGKKKDYYLGWTWDQVRTSAQKLRILVEEGLIKISFKSNSSTEYRLEDLELVREALEAIGSGEELDASIPADLFDHIVGHDEVKFWLRKSLMATQPVHVLLVGPPASGKSLFLEALGSLPGAQYALGGASSKAGIADFLLNFRPRYLIMDEIEKAKSDDLSVLLSLMSSGIVARLKKSMREVERMPVTVFAGCNRRDRLPPELLSRFVEFSFTTYSRDEFIKVAISVITSQLGKDAGLARYIAEQVVKRTLDVRQAIQIAKLVDTVEEVDRFEQQVNASG